MIHTKIPVHATVLSKENHGVLLMGKRGSGKTSTAYCMLERGWKLVTDSVGYVSKEDSKYIAESGSKTRNLYFKYPTIFPELNNRSYGIEEFSPKHNEIRLIIDVNTLFRGAQEEKSDIRLFIFPELSEQKNSQIFELSSSEAFSIFRQDAWHLHHESYDFTEEDEVFVRSMFDQVKCYRLNIGKNWRSFIEELFELDTLFKTDSILHRV